MPKGLVNELEDLEIGAQAETIHTTTLLRSARKIIVLETWGDLLSLELQVILVCFQDSFQYSGPYQ